MDNFFNKSDLSRTEAEKLISETLHNCDDGELYLENSKIESILLDDDKIKDRVFADIIYRHNEERDWLDQYEFNGIFLGTIRKDRT